jgi:hypothetical protein
LIEQGHDAMESARAAAESGDPKTAAKFLASAFDNYYEPAMGPSFDKFSSLTCLVEAIVQLFGIGQCFHMFKELAPKADVSDLAYIDILKTMLGALPPLARLFAGRFLLKDDEAQPSMVPILQRNQE